MFQRIVDSRRQAFVLGHPIGLECVAHHVFHVRTPSSAMACQSRRYSQDEPAPLKDAVCSEEIRSRPKTVRSLPSAARRQHNEWQDQGGALGGVAVKARPSGDCRLFNLAASKRLFRVISHSAILRRALGAPCIKRSAIHLSQVDSRGCAQSAARRQRAGNDYGSLAPGLSTSA
jgi:hypothetical protein